MLGCFNPNLGQIWTNVGLKMSFQILSQQLQLALSIVIFLIAFLTQHLGLSIFDPIFVHICAHNFGLNVEKPSHWVTFLNYIFNPIFEFVHI